MKKIKVIFAATAVILASAGVFANVFVPTTIYFVGNKLETGNNCRTQLADPSPCSTGTQCSQVITVGDETGRFYYSYKVVDGSTVITDCTTLPGTNL